MDNIPSLIAVSFYLADWVIRIVMIFIIPRNRKPSSATAWIMLILFLPFFGLIIFLLLGSPKLPKKRREKQRQMNSMITKTMDEAVKDPEASKLLIHDIPDRYKPFVDLNESLGGMPVLNGNKITLSPDYDKTILMIADDIDNAKTYVHIEYFALAMDKTTEPLFKAIEKAIERGVIVRILFDSIGSHKYPNHKNMKVRLTNIGAQWHNMLPVRLPGRNFSRPDLRNHRKIVVIDSYIGYTGSQNLIQRNYHRKDKLYYDEMVARIMGPVTLELNAAFITDWYSETSELIANENAPEIFKKRRSYGNTLAQVLPSGPGFDNDNNLKLFTGLIHAATKKIVITNPYFVPDGSVMTALTSAAQRGVDVTLINSEIMDQALVGHAEHSFYEELLAAGVKIFWYHYPVLLHSKHMSIDDDIATIGSSNFDMRSFQLDLEVTLVAYDKSVVSDLRKIEDDYISNSKQLSYVKWRERPLKTILFENIARLTSAIQ